MYRSFVLWQRLRATVRQALQGGKFRFRRVSDVRSKLNHARQSSKSVSPHETPTYLARTISPKTSDSTITPNSWKCGVLCLQSWRICFAKAVRSS